jgi:hypothetical protein
MQDMLAMIKKVTNEDEGNSDDDEPANDNATAPPANEDITRVDQQLMSEFVDEIRAKDANS